MNIFKTIFSGGMNLMRFFWHIIFAVFTAEENLVMSSIVPEIHDIAVDIQNKQPGLAAIDFVKAVYHAVVEDAPHIVEKLEHTALITVIATVSHDLGVSSTTGNTGNLPGGNSTAT